MRILWVKSDFLHPTTRGGQIRTLEILKRLHTNHEVHYLAYDNPKQPEGLKRAHEYCTRAYPVPHEIPPHASVKFICQLVANAFSSMPLALSRYCSPAMRSQIAVVTKALHFDSIVCDFVFLAPNFESLDNCILFQHNVETMIWRRHANNAHDPFRELYFKLQAQRMFRWERRMCLAAREVVAVSPQDARLMHELFGITSVSHIPTGVDIEYFRRPNSVPPKADLVFLGSMDWMPNVDGMEYFIREILPLIRKSIPTCTVAIVGRAPSATTLALAKRDPGIQVTGTVPDVRPWLWGAKASIVPLRIGGGTRLKIYESMAAGTATVSTTIGAEGLDVSHPDNIRLADEPSSFALQCVELLENEQERERVASQALQMVTSHFSWDVVVEEFEKRLISVQEDERVSRSSTATSASQL